MGDGSAKESATVAQLISNPASRAFTVLHRYLDNPKAPETQYTISVEVTDDDDPLSPIVMTRSIAVSNETPLALIPSIVPASASIVEGDWLTLDLAIDDPGALDRHQVIIDWGDGSETRRIDLDPSVVSVSGVTHRYRNDPSSGNAYTLHVQVRDDDMAENVFAETSRSIQVNNAAPTLDVVKLFTRDPQGVWLERTSGYVIHEGDEVKITGAYSDPGLDDLHTVQVQWAMGHTTSASIDQFSNTFEAKFVYDDDYALGTGFDIETILVTVSDDDGFTGVGSTSVQVVNVDPVAYFLPEVVSDPSYLLIPLQSRASDPGADALTYQWTASVGATTIQTGTGPSFVLNRSTHTASTIVVSLDVFDGDLGFANYTTAFKFGSSASEVLTIGETDYPAGISTLTVLGLDGDDVIDGSLIAAPRRLVLDGGNGIDYLYGGSGDDTYILRSGNDAANVDAALYPPPVSGPPLPPVVPNYVGNDRYLLKPNSTLTVVDLEGSNSLDFSLASFGVLFNLNTTRGSTLVPQEVATGGHFVAAVGAFSALTGTDFSDQLTGASYATISAGLGADKLYATANTTNASFIGDVGADEFTATGFGLSEISFEGDDGADVFTNLGELSEVVFHGGADADLFTNLGLSMTEVLFEGDDGADVFINETGGSVVDIQFEGDSGSDRFINRGSIANHLATLSIQGDDGADVFENYGSMAEVIFSGGADAELFTNFGGSLTEISFEGDDGADVFINEPGGSVIDILFEGDAGPDRFTNRGSITNFNSLLRISGDDGADLFENFGSLSEIIFQGGADADLFTNFDGSLSEVSFEGDDGADLFINEEGASIFEISFEGDAGGDHFINRGSIQNESSSTRRIQGDDGADIFENFGSVIEVVFEGGADSELFTNFEGSLTEVSFEGDDGADVFINEAGADIIDLSFAGDAGSDFFVNRGTIHRTNLFLPTIHGDDGADLFENFGSLTDLIFEGGADADEFVNHAVGILDQISFEGDDGVDRFTNLGSVIGTQGIVFHGGADADLFTNLGQITTTAQFLGGVGSDRMVNRLQGTIGSVVYHGDVGNDEFLNDGIIQATATFVGGSDADTFYNSPSGTLETIDYQGDDGADSLIIWGELASVIFLGGLIPISSLMLPTSSRPSRLRRFRCGCLPKLRGRDRLD